MSPTLEEGDRLVVEKVSYYFHPPRRGDIIVFEPPPQLQIQGYEKDQAFIKRVIGQAGEIISVENGIVYINNEPLKENYILAPPHYNLPPLLIPEGDLFVMGDNRNNSNDSHVWGFLPQENAIGRAIFRFYPFKKFGSFIINKLTRS
jgi:signal peptidase I